MNLTRLFETQDKLDKRIVKEKGLEGQVLLAEKILALQVELGELANEWRGFKFWSENKSPRTKIDSTTNDRKGLDYFQCFQCSATLPVNIGKDYQGDLYAECFDCEVEMHAMKSKNPLLEEYVDCLHFFLSIGNEVFVKARNPVRLVSFSDNITGQFNSMFYLISRWDAVRLLVCEDQFHVGLNNFLHLGELLGFTWEQVEDAYYSKNKINHERQATGY